MFIVYSSQRHCGPQSCFSDMQLSLITQMHTLILQCYVQRGMNAEYMEVFPRCRIRQAFIHSVCGAMDIISSRAAVFTRLGTLEILFFRESLKGQSHFSKSIPCVCVCVCAQAVWSLVCLLVSLG